MAFRKLMRLPVLLPEFQAVQRWLAAGVIAGCCAVLGLGLSAPWKILGPVRRLDLLFYDALFRFRPPEDRKAADVVIVAVDDKAIEAVDTWRKFGWPWPRTYWGLMSKYLDQAGARAIVMDLLFDRSSVYNNSDDDDNIFAVAINEIQTPTVFATYARPDGTTWTFAPPVNERQKALAAANIYEDVVRTYDTRVAGRDTMAVMALRRAGADLPDWAKDGRPFLLHYYGPHADANNTKPVTFRYVNAAQLLATVVEPEQAAKFDITPGLFRGKIVLIGTITSATYDVKSSPVSANYPGVEIHATAIQNLLEGHRVRPVGGLGRIFLLLGACALAAAGAVVPSQVPWKLAGGALGVVVVLGLSAAVFMQDSIRWLPPAAAMLAAGTSAFIGLGFSYFTEVRQRRIVLNALAQSVSKEVADQIAKDPRKLKLGGERRDMTVMFSDLAGFTTLMEAVDAQVVAQMLQLYLEKMSDIVISRNGYLDKYIGDAIMSFWNAPLNQPDHALLGCRAAWEMVRREDEIRPKLQEMTGHDIHSRIGINSGPMIVGNMGSPHKFAYTVLGDSVNLASRLEGANKMYGTRVLMSETTAMLVKDAFALRKVDLLRVKGKIKPMAVYELVAEGTVDAKTSELIRRYDAAFAHYQGRRFDQAYEALLQMAQDFPKDGPTATMLARSLRLKRRPPPDDWDGVWVAKDK
jgi:adenylate cyclase